MDLNTQSLTKAAGLGAVAGIGASVLGFIPILGFCFLCLGFFIPFVVGALYVRFTNDESQNLDYGPAAVGGAVSAAVAWSVSAIFSICVAVVVGSAGSFSDFGELSGDDAVAAGTIGLAVVVVFLCVGLIFVSAFGAIGAAIYTAMQGRQSAAV